MGCRVTTKGVEARASAYLYKLVGRRFTKKSFVKELMETFPRMNKFKLHKEKEGKLKDQDDSFLFTLKSPELFVDVTIWYLKTNDKKTFYITEVATSYE